MLITLTKRVFWYQVAVFYSTQMLCTVYFVLRVSTLSAHYTRIAQTKQNS
jgi:hypothetical protein